MMTPSRFQWMAALAGLMLFTVTGCKKQSTTSSENSQVASLLFDASSPAAREALATPVDFRLTEANYAQWEQAQRFLDALPRSAFVSASGTSGNVIDRAVQTLEASPRARTAIERTGLSVRDFVLETIALAQAAEASSGKPPGGVTVPAQNVQFVQQYQSRIMQARAESRATRARVESDNETDTAVAGVQSNTGVEPQADLGTDTRARDSTTVGARGRQTDSVGREGERPERPKPSVDSVRDTIPR